MYKYRRLRDLRENHDLTQQQVANMLRTTQQQYGKYENGVQEIPVHHLITLADYYKVTIDYIVGLTNHKLRKHITFLRFKIKHLISFSSIINV